MNRAIITVGLQFGDEGKGALVDFLCEQHLRDVDYVVRYSGGSQCAHNVVRDGKEHTFAQFSSGSLLGVGTYLGPNIIIDPSAMLQEAKSLGKLMRSYESIRKLMTIHPDCLVSTPYHKIVNQIKARSDSCGKGIGETRNYWLKYGEDAIFASDLKDKSKLRRKLELLRQRYLLEAQDWGNDVISNNENFRAIFWGANAISACVNHYLDLSSFNIREIELKGTVIFEGAQGVLLDEYHGFHPYTTWSTVTPHHAFEMCAHFDKIETVGVMRAYTTRHGAGPLPTEFSSLADLLQDERNPTNPYQGKFRFGALDFELLRYAADVCGLTSELDYVAVSWLDKSFDGKFYGTANKYLDYKAVRFPNLEDQRFMKDMMEGSNPPTEVFTEQELLDKIGKIVPVGIVCHGPASQDRKFV